MYDQSCNSNTEVENQNSTLNKSFLPFFTFLSYLWKWDVTDSCVHGGKKMNVCTAILTGPIKMPK